MRGLLALIVCVTSTLAAAAQEFPSRPITLVVPFPAGGAADGVGRTVAEAMREQTSQSVVVDNRVGGNTAGRHAVRVAGAGRWLHAALVVGGRAGGAASNRPEL